MTSAFKPQMTTMNSFQETEKGLFERFQSAGYQAPVAEAASHAFTNFMLGYITAEGVAQTIYSSGADEGTARSLAEMFEQVRESMPEVTLGSHRHGH